MALHTACNRAYSVAVAALNLVTAKKNVMYHPKLLPHRVRAVAFVIRFAGQIIVSTRITFDKYEYLFGFLIIRILHAESRGPLRVARTHQHKYPVVYRSLSPGVSFSSNFFRPLKK